MVHVAVLGRRRLELQDDVLAVVAARWRRHSREGALSGLKLNWAELGLIGLNWAE